LGFADIFLSTSEINVSELSFKRQIVRTEWHVRWSNGLPYNRPARFQSVITSYLREYTWCDVVKEGHSHQYNFIRIMLKVFILVHIHNITLLFNLPLVNYLYLATTLLSRIEKITIHFLCPHTHNCIPGSFYFECPLSAKTSHSLLKLIVLHFQGLRPTFLLPPFYDSVRPSCHQKSPCHGVSTATNNSTFFLYFLQMYS